MRPRLLMIRSPLIIVLLLLLLLPLLFQLNLVSALPTGGEIISNTTETVSPASAGSSTTAGGSFTTLVLNATTQTPRWKAYVGNVTGRFALRSAQNSTIYDWQGAYTNGEVYASRSESVSWTSISCVQNSSIASEETALNMTDVSVDSINNTFNKTMHKAFYVGTTRISNSTCRAIATYVNNASQPASESADFQEVLLQDASQSLVFAAILSPHTVGFDGKSYDFQMIVPESEYVTTPHTYYFWVELS